MLAPGGGVNSYIPTGNLDGVTDPKKVPAPNKAKIFFRPYAAPPETLDNDVVGSH